MGNKFTWDNNRQIAGKKMPGKMPGRKIRVKQLIRGNEGNDKIMIAGAIL